jgi:hypothetical protein
MTDMLLRVYRLSIPFMPKTASNFAVKLTQALLPMINKPSRIAVRVHGWPDASTSLTYPFTIGPGSSRNGRMLLRRRHASHS